MIDPQRPAGTRVIELAALLLSLAILVVLYREQRVDLDSHVRIIEELSHLEATDDSLSREIVETRFGVIRNYDRVTRGLTKVHEQSEALERNLDPATMAALAGPWRQWNELRREKRLMVDDLNSAHSILRASQSYLALARSEALQAITGHPHQHDIAMGIMMLERDLLAYALDRDPGRVPALTRSLAQLQAAPIPPELKTPVGSFLEHARLIIQYTPEIDHALLAAYELPTQAAISAVANAYSDRFTALQKRAEKVRVTLFAAAFVLAFGIVWVVWRLKETAGALSNTVTQLEFQKFALDQHALLTITDADGRITYANEKFCDLSGYPLSELLGKDLRELQAEDDSTESHERMRKTVETGRIWHGESKKIAKDGREFWLQTTIVPFRDSTGRPFQYVGIRTDITRRKLAEAAAEAANRAKSEFLATMSHEIRTPMNGIIGMTSLLMDTPLSPEQRRWADTVRASAESLLTILNDILDFSKIEAGRLEFEESATEIAPLVEGVVDILSPRLRGKPVSLGHEIRREAAGIFLADGGRLRQVLLNLASNAVKFTHQGSVHVAVGVEAENSTSATLRFEVTDTGVGIPDSAKASLFTMFTQADASTSRKFGGTGLGLAISRRIVEIMGGQIGFTSQEGAGSVFWFAVPLKRGLPSVSATEPPAALPAPPPAASSLRVLVAEDNAINQQVAVGLLAKLGHRADIAADGGEAVAAIERGNYDLVLMDMQMPNVDGLAATRMIRALAGPKSRIPIVAMTANAMAGDREECLAAGMDDYIAKPIDLRRLGPVVDKWAGAIAERESPPSP